MFAQSSGSNGKRESDGLERETRGLTGDPKDRGLKIGVSVHGISVGTIVERLGMTVEVTIKGISGLIGFVVGGTRLCRGLCRAAGSSFCQL